MSVLDLSRWQFGITAVHHLIFVALTIGISILVAAVQTAWVVRKDPVYLRMTKLLGKISRSDFARAGIPATGPGAPDTTNRPGTGRAQPVPGQP